MPAFWVEFEKEREREDEILQLFVERSDLRVRELNELARVQG